MPHSGRGGGMKIGQALACPLPIPLGPPFLLDFTLIGASYLFSIKMIKWQIIGNFLLFYKLNEILWLFLNNKDDNIVYAVVIMNSK